MPPFYKNRMIVPVNWAEEPGFKGRKTENKTLIKIKLRSTEVTDTKFISNFILFFDY